MGNQTFGVELKAGMRTFFTGTSARFGKQKRALGPGSLLLILLLITGCDPTTTLFRSNFDATPVDQPPAPAQKSTTISPRRGCSSRAISWLPSSCTSMRPSR